MTEPDFTLWEKALADIEDIDLDSAEIHAEAFFETVDDPNMEVEYSDKMLAALDEREKRLNGPLDKDNIQFLLKKVLEDMSST